MKCECGNGEYYASQRCYHTIVTDENGNFLDNKTIDYAENPYGPYTCTKCGKVYEDIV